MGGDDSKNVRIHHAPGNDTAARVTSEGEGGLNEEEGGQEKGWVMIPTDRDSGDDENVDKERMSMTARERGCRRGSWGQVKDIFGPGGIQGLGGGTLRKQLSARPLLDGDIQANDAACHREMAPPHTLAEVEEEDGCRGSWISPGGIYGT